MPKLSKAIRASLENGDRLVDDARYLQDYERYATSYALSILAQEEYAKAFLLHLIEADAIPWTSEVRRLLHDHTCKQLLASIIDFLEPDIDDIISWLESWEEARYRFPPHISDALNIIRHEKVPREAKRSWIGEDDPPCAPKARRIANGYLDRQKQCALYVRIGKGGQVASTPSTAFHK